MIEEVTMDLLLAPVDIIMHQANCQHTMGSGVAKSIRAEYPEAYEADITQTKRGDASKLGTCSIAKVLNPDAHPNAQIDYIFNMYGQFEYGRGERHTDYEFYYRGLEYARGKITNSNLVLGLPRKMGCKLAGGDWKICRAMIQSVFGQSPIKVMICKYPGDED